MTTPANDHFDAVVRIMPADGMPEGAWGTVKFTYVWVDGLLHRDAPEPLKGDLWSDDAEPRWPPGSDFWPFKAASDVAIVGGMAFARGGRPVNERQVSVRVGHARKRAQVFGTRFLEWTRDGRPRIGPAEPFLQLPLSYENAYGGFDPRALTELPRGFWELFRLTTGDHPGAYPRNQSGKGYVILDSPVEGIELPNLEDPTHLLTADNVVVRDPALWVRQPLSWFFDWHYPAMFPRAHYAGAHPRHPVPTGEVLEEVRRGFVPERWRELAGDISHGRPAPPVYYQEASLGMSFSDLREGTPIEIVGMHPERDTLEFELPRFPRLEIEIEGDRQVVETRLLHVVVTPHEQKVHLTWAGLRNDMPRAFFPGVHARIPITLWVDGHPVYHETPEPVYVQLKRAQAEGRFEMSAHRKRPGEPSQLDLLGELLPEEWPRRERDQVAATDTPRLGDVDPAAGRLVFTVVDWSLPGPVPFAFERHYSSSRTWRQGALGLGWSHCLEQAVWERDGWILYRTADGREVDLPLPSGGLGIGASVHHPVQGVTIVRIASDAYEVQTREGGRFGFTRVTSAAPNGTDEARLTRVWATDGDWLDVRYDTRGRLERLALASGCAVRFEHDARGKLTRVFAPTADGRDHTVAMRYEIGPSGQLLQAVDGAGRTTSYRYRGRHLTQATLPDGMVRRFAYDGVGTNARCIGERWDDDKEREYLYEPNTCVTGIVDATGHSFSIRHNSAYRVDRIIDHFANETTRSYDESSGLLVSQTTPGGETTFLYDARFHLADVTAPARGSSSLQHDAVGRLEELVDADGYRARWSWDHLGRLVAAVDASGASTMFEFDSEGPLLGVRLADEVRLRLERDPQSRIVARIDTPLGSRTATRDALGRIHELRDELGQVTSFRYDPTGRVAQVERPVLLSAFESDARGRVLSRRDGTRFVRLERDGHGRLMHVDEGGAGPRLHRDAEGRVILIESEAHQFWELVRDAAGRVVEESGFGGERRYDLRDHTGGVKRAVCGSLRTTVERDGAGRPVHIEHSDGTFQHLAWSPGGRLTQAREADRVVQLAHDGRGRPVRDTQGEHWVHSQYDVNGRRVSADSSLGLSIRVERDVLGGAMTIEARRDPHRLELRFERNARGEEVRRHLPGDLSVRWQRDGAGRPIERAVMSGERALAMLRFQFREVDRLVRVEDPERGARDHRHDARGRLLQQGSVVRALDEVGHVYRTNGRDDHRYEHGRLIDASGTVFRYDDAGRRVEKETPLGEVRRYRWDGLGRLIEVSWTDARRVSFDYDALGRRVCRRLEEKLDLGLPEPVWESRRETHYVWDGLELLHEIEGARVTSWVWESGRLVGMLTDDGAFAVLTDPLGTPTDIIDGAGAVVWRGAVDCFGALRPEVTQVRCPWRLPGHYEDPDTGLQHTWLRVYDPEIGAYLTPNPLGVIAGTNLYAYLPDPLSETSPLGLGRGYAALGGEVDSERLDAELVARFLDALDRGDGGAGPRERFDPAAARWRLPDPERELWGPWADRRPSEQLPPRTETFTRLPETCGLNRR